MADPAVAYTMTSSGGTIVFNNGIFGEDDRYHLTDIPDLDDPPIRNPADDVPFGDGGLIYNHWYGAWHIAIEGMFLVISTRKQVSIQAIRNSMEESLRSCLRGMKAPNSGSLSWTPLGGSSKSLTVFYDTPLRCPHDQGYLVRNFSFGLVTAESSP